MINAVIVIIVGIVSCCYPSSDCNYSFAPNSKVWGSLLEKGNARAGWVARGSELGACAGLTGWVGRGSEPGGGWHAGRSWAPTQRLPGGARHREHQESAGPRHSERPARHRASRERGPTSKAPGPDKRAAGERGAPHKLNYKLHKRSSFSLPIHAQTSADLITVQRSRGRVFV